VLLAFLVVGAGLYHGVRYRDLNNLTPATPGLPAGAVGGTDLRTGIGVFKVMDARADAAKLAQIRKDAEAKGLVLKDLGYGTYAPLPADSQKPPAPRSP